MNERMLADLFNHLETVVMERLDDGSFRLVGCVPNWFKRFYPEAVSRKEGLRLQDNSPFLENFCIDAESFWVGKGAGRLKSGTFIEMDPLGDEYAMEASALCSREKKILLIELLGTAYEDRKAVLQKARENVLFREYLEEEVCRRTAKIRLREEEIALRLVWATESRDKDTGAHIRRIGLYSEALAKALGWEPQQADDIRIAASMHDIGKIGIPDKILSKAGKLTSEEFEIMKKHTEIGAKILEGSDIPLLQMAKEIALGHHEKWDGSGYPRGLTGKAIPESARIVAIGDVYDALVHSRIYKPAKPEANALVTMTHGNGKHFDPKIFECFLRILPTFRIIRQEFHGTETMLTVQRARRSDESASGGPK